MSWSWLKDLLSKAAGYLAAFFAGKIHEKKAQAEERAEGFKDEAQKFADAPATDDDFERVQRERIKRKSDAAD